MVSLLFRVKAGWRPSELWRDIIIGVNRSLEDLQRAINISFGLDFDHLWFFAKDKKYWGSPVKYVCPREFKHHNPRDDMFDLFQGRRKETFNAALVSLSMLDLSKRDRLYYLFDYGAEWRFYMILTKILEDGDSDMKPVEIRRKGGGVMQYDFDDDDEYEDWEES